MAGGAADDPSSCRVFRRVRFFMDLCDGGRLYVWFLCPGGGSHVLLPLPFLQKVEISRCLLLDVSPLPARVLFHGKVKSGICNERFAGSAFKNC